MSVTLVRAGSAVCSAWWLAVASLKAAAPRPLLLGGLALPAGAAWIVALAEAAVGVLLLCPRARRSGLAAGSLLLAAFLLLRLAAPAAAGGCGCLGVVHGDSPGASFALVGAAVLHALLLFHEKGPTA